VAGSVRSGAGEMLGGVGGEGEKGGEGVEESGGRGVRMEGSGSYAVSDAMIFPGIS
jgi:hypothetical protein